MLRQSIPWDVDDVVVVHPDVHARTRKKNAIELHAFVLFIFLFCYFFAIERIIFKIDYY